MLRFGSALNEKRKTAIYVRVSSLKQKEDGNGIAAQLEICRLNCKMRGLEIYAEYRDEAVSGTTDGGDRHEFNRLLKDAKDGKFNVLVFYSIDRLARDLDVLRKMIKQFGDMGVEMISCREQFDTTKDDGILFVGMLGLISEYELKNIKKRLKMGKQEKKRKSGYFTGILPYGYWLVNKVIEVNPETAAIVKWIYQVYHENKITLKDIAIKLNEAGVANPHKSEKRKKNIWFGNTVGVILDQKEKYEGGVVNENENNIRWPIILDKKYPDRVVKKRGPYKKKLIESQNITNEN